jgi:hypothetical protein
MGKIKMYSLGIYTWRIYLKGKVMTCPAMGFFTSEAGT